MQSFYKYESYRNFSLIHLYRYRVWEDGSTSVSRDLYRIGEDKKLREIIDTSGFGCTCKSLDEAKAYIRKKEPWKEPADSWFDMTTGVPKRRGVRREFLSEN